MSIAPKPARQLICLVPHPRQGPTLAVLRRADGSTELLPAAQLGPDDQPASHWADDAETTRQIITELLLSVRHISTIRFLALPVFFAAFGALADAYLKAGGTGYADRALIPWLGAGLALGFAVFETVLSRNLIVWWRSIAELAADSAWGQLNSHRSNAALWPVRLTLYAPYPCALAYWLHKALACLGTAALPLALLLALLASGLSALVWWRAHPPGKP